MSLDTKEANLEVTVPTSPTEPRPFFSKRMTGFNAQVYSSWIERWARNSAINYPIISKAAGVGLLRGAAKDIPCIVVGIGPSLDENIDALKNASPYALIIATDAALRPLIRHGIHPDLVVNYDARDEQKSMWESIDTSDYVLLANSVTSPVTIDAWKGGLMFFNMMQTDDEFASNILPAIYPHLGQLPNMGTVGNGAVFLAWQMKCSPIMTVGMDLCYKNVWEADPEKPVGVGFPPIQMNIGWKYRAKDYRFVGGSDASGMPDHWEEIENKILYDNDQRLKHTFDEEIKRVTYKVDDCLKFYRNSLLANVGKFDMPVINCSGGVLENQFRSMPLKQAMAGKVALSGGESILRHLIKILPDPRRPS